MDDFFEDNTFHENPLIQFETSKSDSYISSLLLNRADKVQRKYSMDNMAKNNNIFSESQEDVSNSAGFNTQSDINDFLRNRTNKPSFNDFSSNSSFIHGNCNVKSEASISAESRSSFVFTWQFLIIEIFFFCFLLLFFFLSFQRMKLDLEELNQKVTSISNDLFSIKASLNKLHKLLRD
jgi:hypothetical protein